MMTRSVYALRSSKNLCMANRSCTFYQVVGDRCSGCTDRPSQNVITPVLLLLAKTQQELGMTVMSDARFAKLMERVAAKNAKNAVAILIDELRFTSDFFSTDQAKKMLANLANDTFHGVVLSFSMEPWSFGEYVNPVVMCYWGNYGGIPSRPTEMERALTLSSYTRRGLCSIGRPLFST